MAAPRWPRTGAQGKPPAAGRPSPRRPARQGRRAMNSSSAEAMMWSLVPTMSQDGIVLLTQLPDHPRKLGVLRLQLRDRRIPAGQQGQQIFA